MHHALPTGPVDLSGMVVAKSGNVFSVTPEDGSLAVDEPHPLGVYMDDCRHLSGHELALAGPARLTLRLERRLDARGGVDERITVRSGAPRPVATELTLRLAADFAPMLAVRGIVAPPDPALRKAEPVAGGLRMQARGRDGVLRSTTATATPAPAAVERGVLRFALSLEPGDTAEIAVRYAFSGAAPSAPPDLPLPALITVDHARVQRVLDRALADLRALLSRIDGLHYLAAGVPWYATLFGRDSLIAAHQVLPWSPALAEQTLRLLATVLGTRDDPEREEEAGKVLHELRPGEVAGADLSPLARYYGSADATPLWLCLLCEHADWTGDLALFRELRPQVEAMLGWIGDDLVRYAARAAGGPRNHGWKDSEDGICEADGRRLEPPIALVEVQGYVVRARRELARLYAREGEPATAERLRLQAAAMAERLERFWLPDRGYYAMALGGDGRPSQALGSNQGHLLWAGAVTPARAAAIRETLLGEPMFSGWGIRTLAAGQPAYDPDGYHRGTVWPHDCAMVAAGLRDYGFDAAFDRLSEGVLEAAALSRSQQLPELFAGFARSGGAPPVPYAAACRPQAWAAGAVPHLLRAGLGLVAEGLDGRLRIRRPSLPRGVDRAEVRGLRLAGGTVDLVFERGSDGRSTVTGSHVGGDLELSVEG